MAGDLDCIVPHAAGCAVNEHFLAGAQVAVGDEGFPGGEGCECGCGGFRVGDACGLACQLGFRCGDIAGVGFAVSRKADCAEGFVAGLEVADGCSGGGDCSGYVPAEYDGLLVADVGCLRFAPACFDVDGVYAYGVGFYEYLIGGDEGEGEFCRDEVFYASELL